MIMFLRFKIYEYILENSDKIYHVDYQVKLGNLLPVTYETETGMIIIIYTGFLFNKFFYEELLVFSKYAEMITIHLIPYVLKVNLSIITYDFQNSVEKVKDFQCYLEDKQKIIVLYRNNHYDLVYDKAYFEKNCRYLSLFTNLNENLFVLDKNLKKF